MNVAQQIVFRATKAGLMTGGLVKVSASGLMPSPLDGDEATETGTAKTRWMEVTPALARKWLNLNTRNRPLSDETVQAYARDMLTGMWVCTHQGIAFSNRNELLDGQHRLHAIIAANVTVRIMVTMGLPHQVQGQAMTTMDAVDRGRPRSVSDQLKLQHGLTDTSIRAAVCASLGGLCYGSRTKRLSVGQTLTIHEEFRPGLDWLVERRSKKPGLKIAGVLAALAFAHPVEPDNVTAFYLALVSGHGLHPGDAIEQLHGFLSSERAKLLNRGTDRALAEYVLQALFTVYHGSGRKLEIGQEGLLHYRSRQPLRIEKITRLFTLPEAKS